MNLGWKTHSFFEKEQLHQHEVPRSACCNCACGEELAVGCSNGGVVLLDRSLHVLRTVAAFDGNVVAMQYLEANHMLAVLGTDDGAPTSASVKFFNLSAAGPGGAEPSRICTVKLFSPKAADAAETTCLAVYIPEGWPSGSVAVGLRGGAVLLLTGNLDHFRQEAAIVIKPRWLRQDRPPSLMRAVKDKLQRTMLSVVPAGNSAGPITGLLFMGDEGGLHLLATTAKLTVAFKTLTASKALLDEMGAEQGCLAVNQDGQCIIGRQEAFYIYTPDGRGPCFVFEGRKSHLQRLRHYLVAVTVGAGATQALQIYDLTNKLIGSTLQLPQAPRQVFCAWGLVLVIHADDSATCLTEKPLAKKVELLYNKNLYPVALSLARSEQAEPSVVAEIQRRYADHQYNKHDYDGAMSQYVATIGQLEPSYVIKKFLDAQRIHNLTTYLEELHAQGRASSDHTTLLLNCYTKLKNLSKLDFFLKGDGSDDGTPLLNFDVDTAVKVCRAAGYYDHALYVAHAAHEPEWYLDILVDDCGKFDDALAYLQNLARQEAAAALKKHGKVLLNHRPEATTAMLMQLCTPGDASKPDGDWMAKVSDFAHLASDRPEALVLLCEFILNSTRSPPGEEFLYHILLELYLTGSLQDAPGSPPGPEAASQPSEAQVGLEEFPLQVAPSEQQIPAGRQRSDEAMELLRRGWPPGEEPKYDTNHALVLCRMHSFRPGLIFLYEHMRLFREVMQVHMAAGDYEGLIEACMRLGDASRGGDPQLWSEVLEYFGSQQSDVTHQVQEVLRHIEAGNLMPPLVVLSTLAKNPQLKLSVVKGYIARQLKAESAHIEDDRAAIARYQQESAQMRADVEELKSKAKVFQNSKDAVTGAPLDLPAVHFLCGHSFNVRSLGENEHECPLCAPQFRTILDIRRSMRAGATEQVPQSIEPEDVACMPRLVKKFEGCTRLGKGQSAAGS